MIGDNKSEIFTSIKNKKDAIKEFEEQQSVKGIVEQKIQIKKVRKEIFRNIVTMAFTVLMTIALFVLSLNAFYLRINYAVNQYVIEKINEFSNYFEEDFDVEYAYYRNIAPGNENCYTVTPHITIYTKKDAEISEEIEKEIVTRSDILNDVNEGVFKFIGKYIEIQSAVTYIDNDGQERIYKTGLYDTYTMPKYYQKVTKPKSYLLIFGTILADGIIIFVLYKKKLIPLIKKK